MRNDRTYVIEFGVDVPEAGRVFAVESGAFATWEAAHTFGLSCLGKPAAHIEGHPDGPPYYAASMDCTEADLDRPVAGFTVCSVVDFETVAGGTNTDLRRGARA